MAGGSQGSIGVGAQYSLEGIGGASAQYDGGAIRAVFLVNHGARAHDAEVVTPGAVTARDPFTGETIRGRGSLALRVPGHGARMLVVE